jgi:cell division protein FtsW (lipid II flippase)
MGGAATIGLYMLLVLSFMLIAMRASDPFCRIATVGFAGLLFTQAVINIGMTIGLLPITGITLPFISYGGSSLMTTYAIIGLVVNFASRPPGFVLRPSFEFDEPEAVFR